MKFAEKVAGISIEGFGDQTTYIVYLAELRPGRRYEKTQFWGPFETRPEAEKKLREVEREIRRSRPKKPVAPLREVVDTKGEGNKGYTDLKLSCGHIVRKKGGWYYPKTARCDICLKQGLP